MGKANIWPKSAEKLLIFAAKVLISCIFPKNITNFCDFFEKTCTYHVFDQNILSRSWKRRKNVNCWSGKWYILRPQKIYIHFSSEKGCWKAVLTWFSYFTSEPISTQQFQSKNCPWSSLTTQKTKVKGPCLTPLNQLLRVLLTYEPPEKPNIFSTVSFQLIKNYYK